MILLCPVQGPWASSLLLIIVDSFLIANAIQYATTYILYHVELHFWFIYMKAFGEHCAIQIAIDYEMKLKFILFLVFD